MGNVFGVWTSCPFIRRGIVRVSVIFVVFVLLVDLVGLFSWFGGKEEKWLSWRGS